jgi:hypothetical protein
LYRRIFFSFVNSACSISAARGLEFGVDAIFPNILTRLLFLGDFNFTGSSRGPSFAIWEIASSELLKTRCSFPFCSSSVDAEASFSY